ncbi:MAG: hypothetical protein EBU08_08150 [Micrococcales bacterium]|nr:hypothetical protein [Micrococcales bacterium]
MALVVPLASSASVIENILFKVRRGIALSRNASQANPATGVMVDLPEKIDFEMTLLKTHQSAAFPRVSEVSASEGAGESRSTSSSEASVTSRIAKDADSTSSSEQSAGQDVEQSTRNSESKDSSSQKSSESGLGSENEISQEQSKGSSLGKSSEQLVSKGNSIASEVEGRCTYQNHTANREYDKFDTDTGKIEGISI